MKTCTRWEREHRPSGSSPWVRHCGGNRAEILSGGSYFTYNIYRGGRYVTRGSTRTLSAAKAVASRKIR